MFACLLLCYSHVCLSRSRLCHVLCPLWICACQSLRPLACVVAFTPLVDCLDVIICEIHLGGVGVLDSHLSLLRAMFICLPCLLCATHLAFYTYLHLCMLAYMFMYKSVCRPYSNLMELWTPNPNLHLSS